MTNVEDRIEGRDILDMTMKWLTKDERTIINSMSFGNTIAETARMLGIPETTARSRKESAFKKIKENCDNIRTLL